MIDDAPGASEPTMTMQRVEIRLFGTIEISVDGRPWTFGAPPRAATLLGYLLAHAGESISRAALATLMWPDDPEDEARGKLRRHLHRLVRALPAVPAPWIDVTASTIRWVGGPEAWVDIQEFERAAGDPVRLAEAVDLYRGEFLAGTYDDWAIVERERFQSQFLELCYDAALAARRDRDFEAAIRFADRMLTVDEWREDAVRLAMTARYEAGDRSAALAAYERFAVKLRNEMSVDPMPETLALRAAILSNSPLPGQIENQREDDGGVRGVKTPFVGRTAELESLGSSWLRAARGRGSTIFIGGVAGIGKSRLVAELGAEVSSQGGRAIFGVTSNPETFPYEPIFDALRRSLPLIVEASIDRVWLSSLAELLPELTSAIPDLPPVPILDPEKARTRLFEAIARTIEQLARARPLLVVLEDLHWAQGTTLEAIEALARRIGALPVLMLLTYRAEEASGDHSLSSVRRRLQSERRATSLALHGLAPEEVDRLIFNQPRFAQAGSELSAAVYSLSEGNPLFANQLLGSYAETGEIPNPQTAARTVAETILARVNALAPQVRALAETAAAIGRSFTVEVAARVLGWSETEVFDALGTLLDRTLVRETGDTAFSYAFNHALIAAAIYDGIPEERRVQRHRRIAQVMSAYGTSDRQALASIALHWRLGGEPALAGKAYARAAEAAMALYARQEALEYGREAVKLCVGPRDRFDALHVLAQAQLSRVEHHLSKEVLEELSAIARELGDVERYTALERWDDFYAQIAERDAQRTTIEAMLADRSEYAQSKRGAALCSLGWLEILRGNLFQAQGLLREALRMAFGACDDATVALARHRLVQAQLRLGLFQDAQHHIETMRIQLRLRPSLEGRRYLAYAEASVAMALEDVTAFEAIGQELLDVARLAGDLLDEARAHGFIAMGAARRFDMAAVQQHFETGLELCELMGLRQLTISHLLNWGWCECVVGRSERALEHYRRAADLVGENGSSVQRGEASTHIAQMLLELGDAESARPHAIEGRHYALLSGEHRLEINATLTLGMSEMQLGNAEEGLALLRDAVALRRKFEAVVPLVNDLCVYALALLDAKKIDEAIEVGKELETYYGNDLSRHDKPCRFAWTLARVAQAAGRTKDAERYLAHGRALLDEHLAQMTEDVRKTYLALPFNRGLRSAQPVA